MRKATGVFAFVALLLMTGVADVWAIPFDSTPGTAAVCTGTQAGCTSGALTAVVVDPFWTLPPASSTAAWVSYNANTGFGGSAQPANTTVATPTERFAISIPAGFTSLSITVWADDTAGLRLDGGAFLTPPPSSTLAAQCVTGGITCTGAGTNFVIALGGAAHTLDFDVFQLGGSSFGFMYTGELTAVPEPATLLLVGSALAAAGLVSRKRLKKEQAIS